MSGPIDDHAHVANPVAALTAAHAARDAAPAGLRDLVAELCTTVAVQAARIAAREFRRPTMRPSGPCAHKVQQTIAGRCRRPEGVRHHAVLRAVLDTARRQGWTRLATLRASPGALMGRVAAMDSAPVH